MTKRLFDQDVYLTKSTAKVLERTDMGLVLDQTIFFPLGGGQSADKGTINGINVIDVREKDGLIYHKLEDQLLEDQVTLEIDWEKRHDEMQQHCGEHILSGIIKKEYDGNNKGFHIGAEYVTIDIDKKMTEDMLIHIEDLANDVIYKNIEIEFSMAGDESQVDLPVRKEVTVEENIRIVTIPDVDCVACCGTHPKRTGEVGLIKLYKVEKNKGMSRIYFKCGKRALLDYRRKTDIVKVLNKAYSSDDTTLLERYNQDRDKNESLKKAYITLNRNQIDAEIDRQVTDKSYQVLTFEILSSQDMNYVIKKVAEKMNTLLVIYSVSEKKIMMSHDGSHDIKCGDLFREIKNYGGKGGGNAKVAQGVFEDNEAAKSFMTYLVEVING